MEAAKNALAVLASIIGVLTALLTLYAKYLDIQKSNATEKDAAGATEPAPELFRAVEDVRFSPPIAAPPIEAASLERVRGLVKAPAIALITAGSIGLFSNLFMAAFGYINEFVTPLTTETQMKRQALEFPRESYPGPPMIASSPDAERATAVITIITFLSFSIASGAAAWAGYGMLRLRSYWLSVAGSIAVMPGSCVCCLAGFPVGIWSLTVLLRPDVSSSFR